MVKAEELVILSWKDFIKELMQKLNSLIIKFAATLFAILLYFILTDNEKIAVHKEITLENDSVSITAVIKIIDYENIIKEDYTFYCGSIIIKNVSPDSIMFNLSLVQLCRNENEIADIEHNTFATLIFQDTILPPGSSFREDVYWPFEGKLNYRELKNLKLILTNKKRFI